MARRPMIAANWKMHKTHLEAIRDVQKLSYLLDRTDAERVEVVLCPAFTALRPVQTLLEGDRLPYLLGAQDVHHEEQGAFTGEVSPGMLEALKVAYEPVWAIGTGRTPEPSDAGEVIATIRGAIAELHSATAAQAVRCLYGGSVTPGNIRGFMAHPEIDGALVGGASLDPEDLALIVKYR